MVKIFKIYLLSKRDRPVPVEKAPGPAKVLSSAIVSSQFSLFLVILQIIALATVRLFKVNPSTNAYEGVENGAPLGNM